MTPRQIENEIQEINMGNDSKMGTLTLMVEMCQVMEQQRLEIKLLKAQVRRLLDAVPQADERKV